MLLQILWPDISYEHKIQIESKLMEKMGAGIY